MRITKTDCLDPLFIEYQDRIVDSDIDRDNDGCLLTYLQSKYGTLPLMRFDLGHLLASVSVREDEP